MNSTVHEQWLQQTITAEVVSNETRSLQMLVAEVFALCMRNEETFTKSMSGYDTESRKKGVEENGGGNME